MASLLISSSLQCIWFSPGLEAFEAAVLQLFVVLQPTSSVCCLEGRTTLTACKGIPTYQCGDSETACTAVW